MPVSASDLDFLSESVCTHSPPPCRRDPAIYLFTCVPLYTSNLDICQGGGFPAPSGVICETLFAQSTKIDGVISAGLAADQIQSYLAAVPAFKSEDNYHMMKVASAD